MTTTHTAPADPAVLLGETQWPALEQLFGQVFGHALDRRLTAWKYGPGRGLSVAVLDGSNPDAPRAIAHCGLMFRDILVQGAAARAAQITDLMVAPQERGRLSRQASPFARVVRLALEQLGTELNPGNPEHIVYGFPSGRAMRLGEHLGLFREIDQVHELRWQPRVARLPSRIDTAGPELREAVDRLWAAMRQDLSTALVGVRDADYFSARYLQHPTQRYIVCIVRSRWLGRPQAVLALRSTEQGLELSDWVAPLRHLPVVVEAARAMAAELASPVLFTWMTRRWLDRLAPDAQWMRPTEFRILCRADTPDAQLDAWRDHWWLTPGDTDYR